MSTLTNPAGTIAITCTVAAVLAEGVNVEITDDYTVNQPSADSGKVVGRLLKACTVADQKRAVETNFRRVEEITLGGTVAAGDRLKVSSNGATGNQRFQKWTSGSDNADLMVGMALEAGDANEAVDAGFYR